VQPFWGACVIEDIPLSEALSFINEVMLFQMQWQFKKRGRPQAEFDRYTEETVRPIYRDLVARCEAERILQPKVIYGYWPCQSDGNSLIVYDPHDRERELERFVLPRQKKEPWWCLSDFWRPKSTGEYDVLGMSVVTMGPRASEVAREWFEAGRFRDYLYLHGLSVEGAESLAEWIHKRVRVELGIAGHDATDMRKLFQQGYQGSRFSFGYPACPALEDQLKLWRIVEPERIGVRLTEEFQMVPEQSTSAVIAHHPEARYFKA
jgi:5-methyltetrahydrofolate--homocysteine methyltransferase